MQRFVHAQRAVVIVIVAAFVAALTIGFWPVRADVFGNSSYSCGSGFFHSAHTWNNDSKDLQFERLSDSPATGTPKTICPDKVDSRRDLALLVLAIALGLALVAQITLERPRAKSYRSTMFMNGRVVPNARRSSRRVPAPRSGSEESSTQ